MIPRSFHHKPSGLTLLELIAVMVIVLIFIALLAPLGKRVLDAANASKCAANLKTLGQALHTYIAENNGRFPPSRERGAPRPDGSTVPQDYYIYSHYYGGAGNSQDSYQPITFFSGVKPSKYNLQRQGRDFKDAGVFWCPSDKNRELGWASMSYAMNGIYIGGGTAYPNDPFGNPLPTYQPSRGILAAVKSPGNIIYAIDHEAPSTLSKQDELRHTSWPFKRDAQASGPGKTETHVAFERHHGRANALFLDGSVRALTYEDLAETQYQHLDPARQ